jgi:hypothetical protein
VALPEDGKTPDFSKAKQLTSETERDIAGFFWKGSNSILFVKDFGGDENYHLLSVNVQSGEVKDLTPFPKIRASIVDDLLEDPDHVLVQHNKRDPRFLMSTGLMSRPVNPAWWQRIPAILPVG